MSVHNNNNIYRIIHIILYNIHKHNSINSIIYLYYNIIQAAIKRNIHVSKYLNIMWFLNNCLLIANRNVTGLWIKYKIQ